MVHGYSWSRKWINGLFCKEVSLSKEALHFLFRLFSCLFVWGGWDLEKQDFFVDFFGGESLSVVSSM